jgi:hypothetical protein
MSEQPSAAPPRRAAGGEALRPRGERGGGERERERERERPITRTLCSLVGVARNGCYGSHDHDDDEEFKLSSTTLPLR